jgi:hypothetical protein
VCSAIATLLPVTISPAATPDYEQPPISYIATQPHDAASQLKESVERGELSLAHTADRGYLDGILHELKISPSSQTLVFSKTSFQRTHISPHRPRALYFNDDTYVGYVPGGDIIEIASVDPKLGTIFYTVPQSADATAGKTETKTKAKTRFIRETDNCLQCHGESMTRDTPGLLVRSVFADSSGEAILSAGTFLTTHESPLKERWGGWYVTGSTGAKQPHMGNTRWQSTDTPGELPKPIVASNAAAAASNQIPADVDTRQYLTPHSDVVALMVLEHQVEAHNRITRAAHGTLRALRDEKVMADALGEPLKPGVHSDSTLSRIKSSCEPLVEYLLFSNEAKLIEPIAGSSNFAADFSARGPRDSHGRSLRDFDLKTRVFKYPCSYLIYSRSFEELPAPAREYLHRRLWEILTAKDATKPYAHLTPADRDAIAQILRDTKPDLAAAWNVLEKGKPYPLSLGRETHCRRRRAGSRLMPRAVPLRPLAASDRARL